MSIKGNSGASTYGSQTTSNNNPGCYTGSWMTGSIPNSSGPTSQTTTCPDATGTFFKGSGEPMDIDAYRRAGKCFTCSEKGHLACACPKNKGLSIRHLARIVTLEEAKDFVNDVELSTIAEVQGDKKGSESRCGIKDSSNEDFWSGLRATHPQRPLILVYLITKSNPNFISLLHTNCV